MPTLSNDDHSSTSLTIRSKGRPDVVADLSGYEKKANSDKRATYGVVAGGKSCASGELDAWFMKNFQIPATYKGQVDSHPYAVAYLGDGAWAVADAGATTSSASTVADTCRRSRCCRLSPSP